MKLHVALHGYLVAWMAITMGSILEPLGSFGVTAWEALGGMWTPLGQTGCSNELFGIPVQAGASN